MSAQVAGASREALPEAVAAVLREFDIVVTDAGRTARPADLVLALVGRQGVAQAVEAAVTEAGKAPVLVLAPTDDGGLARGALRSGARAVYGLDAPLDHLRGLLFALVGPRRRLASSPSAEAQPGPAAAEVPWAMASLRLGRLATHDDDRSKSPIVERVRPRIVLAEDDAELRRLLGHRLREMGYQVVEIPDGIQLMLHLMLDSPLRGCVPTVDAIITDVRMPGVTGLEMLETLREEGWQIPVLVITAFGDAEVHEAARRFGAKVLDKPFSMALFGSAVKSAVGLSADRGRQGP